MPEPGIGPLFDAPAASDATIADADHPATVLLPRVGQRWHWRPDAPHASIILRVTEVVWNGEEWWITTVPVCGDRPSWNDLSHFMESAVLIGSDDE